MTPATWWHQVTHLGVDEATPPREARYVILLNTLIALAIPLSFIYFPMNMMTELPLAWRVTPSLAIFFGYAVTLGLNYHRRYHWALIWFVLFVTAYLIAMSFAYGVESGRYLLLIALLAATALWCPPHYRKTAILLMTAVLVAFLAIVFLGDRISPALVSSEARSERYYGTALVAVAMLTALVAYHSHRRGAALESSLENAHDELARSQGQIVESEKHAVSGRLAAGLLHEVNTPLGALNASSDTIARSLELVQDDMEPDQRVRTVEAGIAATTSLKAAVARISEALSTLRRFTALDEAELKPYDVRRGIDDTLSLLGSRLSGRVRVTKVYPDTLPQILCQPAKLNRVFLSILENAADAIENEGEIRVRVTEEKNAITVEMVDDGRGIAAASIPTLFEFGLGSKHGRVGMQLGLPMSRFGVEEMGGRLSIASVEGEGTTVMIELPITRS